MNFTIDCILNQALLKLFPRNLRQILPPHQGPTSTKKDILTHLKVDGETKAHEGDTSQETNELIDVPVERKAQRLREEDGTHHFALGGAETRPNHHRRDPLIGEVARLNDVGAAEQHVLRGPLQLEPRCRP